MPETQQPCSLVIEHQKAIGEITATLAILQEDSSEIRKAVSNGLKDKLAATETALNTFIAQTASDKKILASELALREQKLESKVERRADKIDNEIWLPRLLNKQGVKVIGGIISIILLSGISSSGFTMIMKDWYSKEPPGQMKQIADKQNLIMGSLGLDYHSHVLSNGDVLWHTGKANEIAWKIDKNGNATRCPELRTEESLK
jgi:hypothetical protein